MIEAVDLRKEYADVVAVEGSTFSVRPGEIFGLIGPNGAGKTTTLKMLSGLIEPTAGRATVAGYDSQDREIRRRLGFLREDSPLYEEMTARSYLRFFADLYEVPRDVAKLALGTGDPLTYGLVAGYLLIAAGVFLLVRRTAKRTVAAG
jgi:ABC-2 type transport system ATP-binding protein